MRDRERFALNLPVCPTAGQVPHRLTTTTELPVVVFLNPVVNPMLTKKQNYVDHIEAVRDNDTWLYKPQKLPRMDPIDLKGLQGVLPFDGVRNPSFRSNTSYRVFMPYRTPANNWVTKSGIAESAAEAAVTLQFLMSPDMYDLHFQPLLVHFEDESGEMVPYHHDLLFTFRSGYKRLTFVRFEESLNRPKTMRDIEAIAAATPKSAADDMIVVNASDYTRQRRENLLRLYYFMIKPDHEADDLVWRTAQSLRTLYYMKDLFSHVSVSQKRAFGACHRLIAQGFLRANLDHVLWENSHIRVAV